METTFNTWIQDQGTWFIIMIIVLALWDAVWRLIALWHSARRSQLVWFIFLGILNTVGVLPIIYLLVHRGKSKQTTQQNKHPETE